MIQVRAQIVDRQTDGASQELRLQAASLSARLMPGQAVLVRTGWGGDPYLRRTFYPVTLDADTFSIRVPAGGDRGYAWLKIVPLGSEVDCLGPVGHGFSLPDTTSRLLCLGIGETAWTLLPLVWQAAHRQIAVTFVVEVSTARQAPAPHRLPLSTEYRRFVLGQKRTLKEALPELLTWPDRLAVAAPATYYSQLADAIQRYRILLNRDFAQVLYPASFLCGTGACQACAVDIAGGRRRVCLRGPVFDLVDIIR